MARDASPKRKSSTVIYQVLDIVKQWCDFPTLFALYCTSKKLWPLFRAIDVSLTTLGWVGVDTVHIPTFDLWQQLFKCYRVIDILDSEHLPFAQKMYILSLAFDHTESTEFFRNTCVFYITYPMWMMACVLNGNQEFFQKHWGEDWRDAGFSDVLPPLLGTTLNPHLRKARKPYYEKARTALEVLRYANLTVCFRSVGGIIHLNAALRVSDRKGSVRRKIIENRTLGEWALACQVLPLFEKWGHPRAATFIKKFLIPMTERPFRTLIPHQAVKFYTK